MLTSLMTTLGFKPKPNTVRTLQDAYEAIRTHFLTQKVRAVDDHMCVYRGPNGIRCAVGVLIDDKHYNPDFESLGVNASAVRDAVEASTGLNLRDNTTISFLTEAQRIHDNSGLSGDLTTRVDELDKAAIRYGLEVK